jgi:hypothetical protein
MDKMDEIDGDEFRLVEEASERYHQRRADGRAVFEEAIVEID